ncbi:tripartite motif-containing protein 16-like [Danio aesculapii]|uniref:tripartite motif-containing protein 16-like n=1 Tax=Danio aesculapii TaxID=1142201 RepID=UPI0024C0C890|nr:tripartite motif-containing protein 16-like [Danio aesculapii]
MAESSVSLAQEDQFNCLICLDLLKDPVAIPCGHSYCKSCISGYWDQDEQKGVYSCPQCRQTFTARPALGKNTILVEVVENIRKRKLQAVDVECDVCTGRKYNAVKYCLVCLESYCQTHFEQHEEFHSKKRHKVTDATGRLQEMICPQHDRLLEMYCRTDQRCICMLCLMNKHKTHETVLPAEERAEKQKHFKETLQQRVEEKQKECEELRAALESHKRSAQAAVEDTERIFTELIRSIERSRSEVTQLIRDQEKASVSGAEGRLQRLEQEIDDLWRRGIELEQLSHTDHHIIFLQSFQSLSVPPASADSSSIRSRLSFDSLKTFISRVKEKLQQDFKEEKEKISGTVRHIRMIPTPEYESRNEFLPYYQRLTLDSNTAYKSLRLSEGNRVVTRMKKPQQYPHHPDRFDSFTQVLCGERVCGRCYWEVEWRGDVEISVSYQSISRKGLGNECIFGCNDQSWSLQCSDFSCIFWHNSKPTKLSVVSSSYRIGVYVDHSAGTLSFYSVSDTMSLIHRVHTTFTQPLYPGFGFYKDSQLKLCDLV